MIYKFVIHLHSIYSYDGTLTLSEIKNELIKYGVNICFMTEHAHKGMNEDKYNKFVVECKSLSDDNFKIIPGLEYNSSDGPHVLVPCLYSFTQKTGCSVEEIGRFAKINNTISILAHPRRQEYKIDKYLNFVDGIELINTNYEKLGDLKHIKYFSIMIQNKCIKFFGLDFHLLYQFKDLLDYINIFETNKNICDVSIQDVIDSKTLFKNCDIKNLKRMNKMKQIIKQVFQKYARFFVLKNYIKKIRKLYSQQNIIYPKPLQIQSTDKILVLAPHADDESIGCGGILLKYSEQCKVVCLTDGRLGDPSVPMNELMRIRKEEFIGAMNFAKVEDYQFLNTYDGNLLNEFYRFNEIEFENFEFIFIPNILDQHPDHKAVGIHLVKLLKSKKLKVKVCMYEVWNALALPNNYIDISDISDKKKELVSLYQSQTKHIDYQNRILSLNNYRGMSVGVEYAEVYSCVSVSEFMEMMK